jgi:hypothetical protein
LVLLRFPFLDLLRRIGLGPVERRVVHRRRQARRNAADSVTRRS